MSDLAIDSKTSHTGGNAFACALLVLLAVNLWLSLTHPLHHLPTATLERGEAYNATQSFQNMLGAPDVVLLGSSLVTAPIMQSEADYLDKPIARMSHRRSTVLQNLLTSRVARPVSVFCLAIGGEMVSDAYLITKHLLCSDKQPKTIVYGIGPRDFQDNLMPGVDSSETFQVLADLSDLPELLKAKNITVDRKVNVVLQRISPLWRYHSDIATYLTLRMKKLMETCLPYVVFDKYDNQHQLKPRKRGQFPEEAKGEPKAFPGIALDHLNAEQTHNEYLWRYNPLSLVQLKTQCQYLDRFLSLCHLRGITVVMVNMPLSHDNLGIMPNGLYRLYMESLQESCRKYSVSLLDLNQEPWNKSQNFVDTVHLTPEISSDFLLNLSDRLSQTQAAVALKKPPSMLSAGLKVTNQ